MLRIEKRDGLRRSQRILGSRCRTCCFLLRFANHRGNRAGTETARRGQCIGTGHGANTNIETLRTRAGASAAYVNRRHSHFRRMACAVNDTLDSAAL